MSDRANETTKVRFELWCVLGFMLVLGMIVSGFLYDALATGKRERIATNQIVESRLTKLETNYVYIMNGLDKLERSNEKVVDALKDHEKSTTALMRVKKWNSSELKSLTSENN